MAKRKRMSKKDIQLAEYILADAVRIQHLLWDKLGELEDLVGTEVSAVKDLEHYNLDDIREGMASDG